MVMHEKCRGGNYTRSNEPRVEIPDDKVSWELPFHDYHPKYYISPSAINKPWSDPDIGTKDFKPTWNKIDSQSNVDRSSFVKHYDIGEDNFPRNPNGRTGIKGRGVLGRWGPNHAADPIVTRWKKNSSNEKVFHITTKKPILQFVAILREDTKEWAIPGGMVDPGEVISETLKREFLEEAMNFLEQDELKRENMIAKVDTFFKNGSEVYKGYVDDPRNTDNSWMETVAYNFHDEKGEYVQLFKLHAGDDAVGVKWMDISNDLKLYASHKDMIHKVAKLHDAHWSKDSEN